MTITMRNSTGQSRVSGLIVITVVLALNTSYLGAQTNTTQRNNSATTGSQTQASESEVASKKKSGGQVTITVGGSGVAGHIARWMDSNTLESSVISQDGGRIGISTTTPTSKLTVNGRVESLSGGFRFPDGTTQNTAGLE